MATTDRPQAIEAASPFEMRVKLGAQVPESEVRTARATGEMGFLHSFTTGKVWIRFVLVPGLTGDAGDIGRIARFTAGLGNVERVEVLPFHQLGRFKWERLGLQYALDTVNPPSHEATERACAIFRAEGLTAV